MDSEMEIMTLLILVGVAIVVGMMWKMLSEQRRHHQAIEITLAIMKEAALNRLTSQDRGASGEAAQAGE